MSRCLRVVCVFVLAACSVHAEADKPILPGHCLVLKTRGRFGRHPLPYDLLQAAIIEKGFSAPRENDLVKVPGIGERTWKKATAKDGVIEHPDLRGGYAFWSVKVPAARVMILEASGHGRAWINSEPRGGDPYNNGIVRIPVALRAGNNELLFLCGRGQVKARLVPPQAAMTISPHDFTLPDLIAGEKEPVWGAVVVVNAQEKPAAGLVLAAGLGGTVLHTPLPPLPPSSVRKVAFRIPATMARGGETVTLELKLHAGGDGKPALLDSAKPQLAVRDPADLHKRTFLSDIDRSVQYYSVRPAKPAAGKREPLGLVLTLHGAAVEANGQAASYAAKSWAHIVAPTNRRPFGFDWEDWGRLDALEVLDIAQKSLKVDPRRIWLTGHSMGGHGTWHLGATYPDRWAAIAPSAGWVSFGSYLGGSAEKKSDVERLLGRCSSPSDTVSLLRNYARFGVYVLHGDADDNVPVREARFMRKQLGEFHPDFAYYERPGAGHWWGAACMDWPPLMDFLQARTLPKREEVRRVDFVTASPGVSGWCHWAGIEAQVECLKPSEVHLRHEPAARRFTGTTANAARLVLDLAHLPPEGTVEVELDGHKVGKLAWPSKAARIWLEKKDGKWTLTGKPDASLKGPHRYGPFKEAFRNRMLFVYGTRGTKSENAWAYARARFDAETFWYRGNGSVDVVADTDFDPKKDPDRNVILYGHAESSSAWKPLLEKSPVQVRRGVVEIAGREDKGDFACLFVRPRPGSDKALVGVVSGSGPAGQRLSELLPYFASGIGYPDCLVLSPLVLTKGSAGVIAAGFFGVDWRVESGEFVRPAAR